MVTDLCIAIFVFGKPNWTGSRSLPIAQPFVPPSRHELSATQLFALVLFGVLLPLPPTLICYWLLYVSRENTIYPLHRSAAGCCSRSALLALLLQNTVRDSCRPAAVSRFSSPAYAIRDGWWRDFRGLLWYCCCCGSL